MTRHLQLAAVAAALALGSACAQATVVTISTSPAPVAVETQPAPSPAMQHLMDASHRLRDASRRLAQQPPGPSRDAALASADEALRATQRAMLDVPGTARPAAPAVRGAGGEASVQALTHASDRLYAAVHTLARRPAGPARNEAIRDVDRALLDTQVAMANAYDATAFAQPTRTLGAGPAERTITLSRSVMECTQLDTMLACH
jgi:hypothetical protein